MYLILNFSILVYMWAKVKVPFSGQALGGKLRGWVWNWIWLDTRGWNWLHG